MRSDQSALMMLCGMLALCMLFIFSAAPAVIIMYSFNLPETYLGGLLFSCMAVIIGLFVVSMRRGDKRRAKKDEDYRLESELKQRKRALFYQASDFEDSRNKIAQRAEWARKSKRYSMNDNDLDDYYLDSGNDEGYC